MEKQEKSLWRIAKDVLLKSEKRDILFMVGLSVVGVVVEALSVGLVLPVMTILTTSDPVTDRSWIPDFADSYSQESIILLSLVLLAVVYFVKAVFLLWSQWVQSGIRIGIGARLTHSLFSSYLAKPYSYFLNTNSSILIRNVQNAAAVITGGFEPALLIATDSLIAFTLLTLLLVVEPMGTLLTVALFVLYGIIFQLLTRRRLKIWGQIRMELTSQLLRQQQQSIGGIKEVKIRNVENYFANDHYKTLGEAGRVMRKFGLLNVVPRVSLEVVTVCGLLLLINAMTLSGDTFAEQLPVLGLFAVTAFRIQPAIIRTLNNLAAIKFNRSLINDVYQDLSTVSLDQSHSFRSNEDFLELDLVDVNFSFERKAGEVLSNVNLKIRRGDLIGIGGESGSGKSTLIDVILGLLEPSSGSVLLNNVPIGNDMPGWRNRIGFVPQSIYLLDDSIARNVAFGVPENQIDLDRVDACLKAASLEDLAKSSPAGLAASIGERGVRISGGQRQRLGLARALYNSPEILLLDEATSALDSETEEQILDTLLSLSSELTIVLIAHRESTLRICNRRFFVESGKVTEILVNDNRDRRRI